MNNPSAEPLFHDCAVCAGKGRLPNRSVKVGTAAVFHPAQDCTMCDGTGMIFSASGGQVAEIVRRLIRGGRL